jgi:pyridoxal phosphate enzyme (YggS family)
LLHFFFKRIFEMAVNRENFERIRQELSSQNVCLVAVSKTKPVEDIRELYSLGQRDFGENYVQELADKQPQLPGDIRWHFIGHLQSNKVKYIAPFVHLIHGIDSLKLLNEVAKQGQKLGRRIPVLLQVFISGEETKFGFDPEELDQVFGQEKKAGVEVRGLMGMASFTEDMEKVRREFGTLRTLFDKYASRGSFDGPGILSMGMSADFGIALEEGSNLVRIGSLLFGSRE